MQGDRKIEVLEYPSGLLRVVLKPEFHSFEHLLLTQGEAMSLSVALDQLLMDIDLRRIEARKSNREMNAPIQGER